MHGPIKSLYSQVFWTSMSNDIPQEVVERFKDSAIAIVGLEMDQVRVDESELEINVTHLRSLQPSSRHCCISSRISKLYP